MADFQRHALSRQTAVDAVEVADGEVLLVGRQRVVAVRHIEYVLLHVEFLLLHLNACVTQDILFLCKFGFGVEYLQVEVVVGEYEYVVAGMNG